MQYWNPGGFKEKATETMRIKRITVTVLCNYLGYNGIDSLELCMYAKIYYGFFGKHI